MLPHPVPITQAIAPARLHIPRIQTAFANTPLLPKLSSGEKEQASAELIRENWVTICEVMYSFDFSFLISAE